MTKAKLTFVSFEPERNTFRAYLDMEEAILNQNDPEKITKKASFIYESAIKNMIKTISDIRVSRETHKLIAARDVWSIGDTIFSLVYNLKKIGLQIDGVYDHLIRDVGEKKKWLEKAITLRRYLPEIKLIPKTLNWGRLEKGTRKKVERLKAGLPLD
jgi:hypothetical protein